MVGDEGPSSALRIRFWAGRPHVRAPFPKPPPHTQRRRESPTALYLALSKVEDSWPIFSFQWGDSLEKQN